MTKNLILAALIVALAGLHAAPGQFHKTLRLVWTDPNTNAAVQAFNIYHSTNVALALTNWTLLAAVPAPATNWTWTNTAQILAGPNYFYATASNMLGESLPSNVAWSPSLPPSDLQLKAQAIP